MEKLYKEHSVHVVNPVRCTKRIMITASMVKYCINSFLATKVTFMNEMYDVLKKSAKGADWNTFSKDNRQTDPRIGKTHMKVPGAMTDSEDTQVRCFPKDTSRIGMARP